MLDILESFDRFRELQSSINCVRVSWEGPGPGHAASMKDVTYDAMIIQLVLKHSQPRLIAVLLGKPVLGGVTSDEAS